MTLLMPRAMSFTPLRQRAKPSQSSRAIVVLLSATRRWVYSGCLGICTPGNPQVPMQTIRIRGARTHNLANIDLDLPRERLIVITGLSGSGKSSLAFDTLYAEGQRRYVESL